MYSSRAFIRLTGSTAKSLRHYERLGLLAPERTAAGYRRYSLVNLGRVQQILALKSLGLSLHTIKGVLDGQRIDLASHREQLDRERDQLTRAIDALSQLPAQVDSVAAFSHFVAEFTWERGEAVRQRYAESTPRVPARVSASRLAAFHALAQALEVDPGSEQTRALAIAFRSTGPPGAQAAVTNRAAWPSGMRRYFASLYDASPDMWERVLTFLETLQPANGAASCP